MCQGGKKKMVKRLLIYFSFGLVGTIPSHFGFSEIPVIDRKVEIELGKTLYFDPRLSKDGTISCNSCHNLMGSGTDLRPHSIGVGGAHGGRKAPTVWNVALMSSFFWDGRALSLEEQAKGPLINPIEMGMPDHKSVEDRVKKISSYVPLFMKAYGNDSITINHIAQSIANFERTLVYKNSPFDEFIQGNKNAISENAKRGWQLVRNVGCLSCHNGENFSGPNLEQGTPFLMRFPIFEDTQLEASYHFKDDLGRFNVTQKEEDKHMWRVASWRNVALTAPYFHNGSVAKLEDAVKIMAKLQLGKELKDDEVKDIVAFLSSLTSRLPEIVPPRLPLEYGQALLY